MLIVSGAVLIVALLIAVWSQSYETYELLREESNRELKQIKAEYNTLKELHEQLKTKYRDQEREVEESRRNLTDYKLHCEETNRVLKQIETKCNALKESHEQLNTNNHEQNIEIKLLNREVDNCKLLRESMNNNNKEHTARLEKMRSLELDVIQLNECNKRLEEKKSEITKSTETYRQLKERYEDLQFDHLAEKNTRKTLENERQILLWGGAIAAIILFVCLPIAGLSQAVRSNGNTQLAVKNS